MCSPAKHGKISPPTGWCQLLIVDAGWEISEVPAYDLKLKINPIAIVLYVFTSADLPGPRLSFGIVIFAITSAVHRLIHCETSDREKGVPRAHSFA